MEIEEFGQERDEKKKSLPKKVLLFSLAFMLAAVAGLAGALFFMKDSEVETLTVAGGGKGTKADSTPKSRPPAPIRSETNPPASAQPQRREIIHVKLTRNPFKEFYEKEYIEKVKEKLARELLREIEEKRKEEKSKLLAELQRKLRAKPVTVGFKVYAILCTEKCYAITSEGVKRDGEVYKGKKLRVTEGGVHLQ